MCECRICCQDFLDNGSHREWLVIRKIRLIVPILLIWICVLHGANSRILENKKSQCERYIPSLSLITILCLNSHKSTCASKARSGKHGLPIRLFFWFTKGLLRWESRVTEYLALCEAARLCSYVQAWGKPDRGWGLALGTLTSVQRRAQMSRDRGTVTQEKVIKDGVHSNVTQRNDLSRMYIIYHSFGAGKTDLHVSIPDCLKPLHNGSIECLQLLSQ